MLEIIIPSVIGGVIFLFVCYLVVVALVAPKKRETKDVARKGVSEEKTQQYVEKLSKMIALRTVYDENLTNKGEYDKFYELLEKEFPNLASKAILHRFENSFLFEIKGKGELSVLLMSHHDVVGEEGEWETPAFEPTIKDGALYGRGTIDTKTPLFSELQAVEELLKEGFEFPLNVFIGSSGNEECGGNGMPNALKYFEERGLHFDVIIDEGGAIVEKMMPGVKEKSAMVAVHEKGRHKYKCTAKKIVKGHTGLNPTKDYPVERLAKFIAEIKGAKLFKNKFTPEVEGLFKTHAPYMPFVLRIIMSNFNVFKGLLLKILGKVSPVVEAMLATTMYFTKIEGNNDGAEAVAFFRCMREEDLMEELEEFKRIAKKYAIEIEQIERDYCIPSSANTPQFARLKEVLNKNFPDVIVSPFLLTAGTDARHLGNVADCILRFAPIDLDTKQYASIHNVNEHIKVKNVGECVEFYKDFIKSYK